MARTPVAGALWLVVSRDERRRPCRPPRSTHRRLDSSPRNLPGATLSIDDGGVSLSPPGGPTLVPLGDVATLEFKPGPAEIARDAQSRRTSVEFNVRDADLPTVANAAKASVDASLKLPVGYRPEWGGQFQHYTEAKQRLAVVVPLAPGLIAFLLWLAFRDARAAGLIFLGVPFAVVGGVLALSARGIPFSISAGVGFVALFGVAVLNGLVLVSFARDLERRGRRPRRRDPRGHGGASTTRPHDGSRGQPRVRPDGPLDRSRRGSPTSARHRRDRRPSQRDRAHVVRFAGAVHLDVGEGRATRGAFGPVASRQGLPREPGLVARLSSRSPPSATAA